MPKCWSDDPPTAASIRHPSARAADLVSSPCGESRRLASRSTSAHHRLTQWSEQGRTTHVEHVAGSVPVALVLLSRTLTEPVLVGDLHQHRKNRRAVHILNHAITVDRRIAGAVHRGQS